MEDGVRAPSSFCFIPTPFRPPSKHGGRTTEFLTRLGLGSDFGISAGIPPAGQKKQGMAARW